MYSFDNFFYFYVFHTTDLKIHFFLLLLFYTYTSKCTREKEKADHSETFWDVQIVLSSIEKMIEKTSFSILLICLYKKHLSINRKILINTNKLLQLENICLYCKIAIILMNLIVSKLHLLNCNFFLFYTDCKPVKYWNKCKNSNYFWVFIFIQIINNNHIILILCITFCSILIGSWPRKVAFLDFFYFTAI